MNRRITAVVAILVAIACACGPGQRSSSGAGGAASAASAPRWLDRLGAATSSLMYLNDPLPPIDRLLRSDELAGLLARPEIARLFDEAPDLDGVRASVAEAAPSIPRELALGFTDTGVQTFARIMRLSLLITTLQAASAEPAAARDLPGLRGLLLDEVRATRVPHVVLWARMRSPGDARRLYDMLTMLADQVPSQFVQVRATPTEIAADLDAGKVMEAGQLAEVLTHLGVAASASDPVTTDMVTAIRRLRVRAVLTIEGDELRLAIGDGTAPAAAPRAGVADLGPLFVAGAPELAAWARWDIAALVPLIADAVALLDRIEGTAAGRARLAADSEDLGGDLRDLQRDLARAPVRGQMRMDLSDRVRFDVLEHDPPPATPLVRTGLLGLIPPDAPIVSLSAVDGLGDALARSMKQAEDRMAMRSLRELLGSDGVDGAEGMEQAYYRQFAALRQLVLRDARQVFTPPVAYVITTATAIAQLSAETRSPGSRPDRASLADLPIVEYAIVGKATDLDRAVRWLEEVYREAAVTALAIGGGTLPAGAELVARRDLGLGVPTYALSLGWLGAATGGALTVDIRGDLALHAFTRGDFFVISTSVALSRRMLRDDDAPFTLVDPALVTYGRFRSAAITGYLDRLGAWFRVHAPDPGTSSALQAARAALGLVDGLEWWGRDQAGGRLTRAELRFSGSAR